MQHIARAMQDPDHWLVELSYHNAKGKETKRVVSPIRFFGQERFLALCLCAEACRQFRVDRCSQIRLVPAHEYVMPVPFA